MNYMNYKYNVQVYYKGYYAGRGIFCKNLLEVIKYYISNKTKNNSIKIIKINRY